MNIEYTNFEKVLAIVLACLATGIWRLIGAIFYNKISEDGIRDAQESRGLGDVYKRQFYSSNTCKHENDVNGYIWCKHP